MTNDQPAEHGAAPAETLSESEVKAEPLDNASRITFEKLRKELAAEPVIEANDAASDADTDDTERPGKSLTTLSASQRAAFGAVYPALKNSAVLESAMRGPALNNFSAIQAILQVPALALGKQDLIPGLQAVLQGPALVDWKAAAGLRGLNDLNDVASRFAISTHGLAALTALEGIDTRNTLLGAIANVETGAFRHAHLDHLAAAMTALDVNKTLLGGLAANAGIYETLGQFVLRYESTSLASFAESWNQQMLSQVEARELLLLKATGADPLRRLLSARPLSAFNRYLDGLPLTGANETSVREALTAGRTHSFAVDAFVAHDALLGPLDDTDRDEVIEIVETVIIEAWQEARSDAAAHLRARLAGLDRKLEELYLGAWEHLASKGPGYMESSCHLANEVLGRALRQLAPDESVRTWAAEQNFPAKDVESTTGRLTRKIRLRYIKRYASRDERNLLICDVEALAKTTEALINRFNAGKHDSIGTETTLRTNLVSCEAVLLRIFD